MITLEELIARQRFSLNRSTKASKIADDTQRPNAATASQWAEFEKSTAEATAELAEGLEARTGQPFPMLHDAQKEILAAATDLEGRKFEPCAGHDRDALTNLVKARDTVRMVLSKPQPSSSAQEMRNFDRTQAQKLRRPKEKDEQQEAEQLPERLRQLAKQEEFVYATAAKPPENRDDTSKSKAKSSGNSSSESPAGTPSERQDLQKVQSEIVEEAKDVEETMRRLGGQKDGRAMSELARSRMSGAVKKAEETAGALDRGHARRGGRDGEGGCWDVLGAGGAHRRATRPRGGPASGRGPGFGRQPRPERAGSGRPTRS